MAHSYTPGLTVTPRTLVARKRLLPIPGVVLVQEGESVSSDKVVARAELPGKVHVVNVVNLLGILPEDLKEFMVKREGERVEQGQVLAEIEPIHYRDQVEQARGKLDLAEAELQRQDAGLAKLKKEVPLQIDVAKQTLAGAQIEEARSKEALKLTTDEVQKTIDESKAAVELAKANLTLAKQEFDRWMELAAQDATTKRKAQEVTRAHDAAKAELRLAERASSWNARPENRHLPAWWEWLNIRLLTHPKDWTPSQRRMMRHATRYHVVRGLVLSTFLTLLLWGSWQGFGTLKAQALRDRLVNANTADVPLIVDDMTSYRRWVDPLLRQAYRDAGLSPGKLTPGVGSPARGQLPGSRRRPPLSRLSA